MSDYVRNPGHIWKSPWDTDANGLTWYDNIIGRTQAPNYPKLLQQSQMEHSIQEEKFDADHAWYYKQKELDAKEDNAPCLHPCACPARKIRLVPPPVPKSSNVPFDYMFDGDHLDDDDDDGSETYEEKLQDYQICLGKCINDQASLQLTEPDLSVKLGTMNANGEKLSPSEWGPATPVSHSVELVGTHCPNQAVELHEVDENSCVPEEYGVIYETTPHDTDDSNPARDNCDDEDAVARPEAVQDREYASVSCRLTSPFSPAPPYSLEGEVHAYYELGTSDRFLSTNQDIKSNLREEEIPETQNQSTLLTEQSVEHDTVHVERPVLKAKSPRRTLARKILSSLSSPRLQLATTVASKKPDIAASYETSSVSRKRRVSEWLLSVAQFPQREEFNEPTSTDCHAEDFDRNKRLRTSFHAHLADLDVEVDIAADPSLADGRSGLRAPSTDFFDRKPLPSPPHGYAGQFEGMLLDNNMRAVFPFENRNPIRKEPLAQTFGSKALPNGQFTHHYFRCDPWACNYDFRDDDIPDASHPLFTCMEHATDMTVSSCHPNIIALRNKDEEILRREAHIECAAARLDGISVGFWRYLQGAYGIEEYRRAELCICWDICWCNKMCTRYGDLKCPCSKDIIIHG